MLEHSAGTRSGTEYGDEQADNVLWQFIKSRTSIVDEKIVKAATVGLKDTGTSSSAVWDRLFRIPVNKKGKNQGRRVAECARSDA